MPLFRVHARPKRGASHEELAAHRQEHLLFHARLEKEGKLFAAGMLGADQGMYILFCEDETEARRLAEADPYHMRGLREYELLPWRFNLSSHISVETRARLNGDDPSNPRYYPGGR